ncbi:MAG: DUF542 domain-containing protein, partial [Thermoanaerobaculia bacterium]
MPAIDPQLPVKELLEQNPEFRPVLAAYDIDTCCGGEHPLAQACQARGIDVEDVIRELGHALAAGDPAIPSPVREGGPPQRWVRGPAIPPTADGTDLVVPAMSIREILRRFPSTSSVFEKHGLGDCGGDGGPDEPLGWFATVHRIALDPLMAEVRQAAAREASQGGGRSGVSVAKAPSLPFTPEFILGPLVLALTLGATTGMINLLRIAAGGDVPFSHRQMHAHTQILGFAALFLMGIAFHALPRITGVGGGPPRFARLAFWLMAGGVLLRNFGQPFNLAPVGRAASLLSGISELSAGCLFALFVADLIRRAPVGKYQKSDPFLQFLGFGTLAFLAALLVNAVQSVWLAGHLETALPAALVEPFY